MVNIGSRQVCLSFSSLGEFNRTIFTEGNLQREKYYKAYNKVLQESEGSPAATDNILKRGRSSVNVSTGSSLAKGRGYDTSGGGVVGKAYSNCRSCKLGNLDYIFHFLWKLACNLHYAAIFTLHQSKNLKYLLVYNFFIQYNI